MLFAIDIDGTIAQDEHGHAYARYLNQALALNISEEIIEHLPSYLSFIMLPEVQAYVQNNEEHKQKYVETIRVAQHDPDVQRSATPMHNSVEGVKMLAEYGQICYITCRKSESQAITQEWLAQNGFLQPERVFFCEHYHHKYIAAHEQTTSDEPIILIDDHAEEVLKFFKRLIKEQYKVAKSVYKRVAIVAYGSKQLPIVPPKLQIPVFSLVSWNEDAVERLIHGSAPIPI